VPTSSDYDRYGKWFSVRVELLETGTDWDTAGRLLAYFENLVVSLKVKGRARYDAKIVGVHVIRENDPLIHAIDQSFGSGKVDEKAGGIVAVPVDDDGDPIPGAPEEFFRYEDVEGIAVY
jgi:hypothetical protein